MSEMSHEDRLTALLLRWEECWEHGEDVPALQLCIDCPDLAEVLQAKIDILKKMSWMKDTGSTEPLASSDTVDSLIGKTLAGRYQIEALIAEGGFGRVYRAFDPELQRPVAIKVPKIPATSTGNLLEEARKVARLRHPGIVSVHDVGQDDGMLFIVTDLIDGINLAELISGSRPNSTETARLVADIADALSFAHQEGFIHRDIKPANILIDRQDKPLIADFGIAATAEELTLESQRSSGTLSYMAPEQLANEVQLIDGRTDVYALGVVLYEMLSGHMPYNARTPTALREQILFRSPLPIDGGVPDDLRRICLRCLSKHPADRFPTARSLANTLRESAAKQAQTWSWRIPLIGSLLAVVAAVGVYFVPSFIQRGSERGEAFVFDGTNRIVTPLERFAPVTLEAWVRPERYEQRCHFVVGSDIVTEYGIGMGMSGVLLSCEYIAGDYRSKQVVPLREWSHIAAVFGEKETRLYYNGKLVGTGPPTRIKGGTHFVIGNVGENNPIDYFVGQIRTVRISQGERYASDFVPDHEFAKDSITVLIYDGRSVEDGRVIDLSGAGNHGTLTPSALGK